MGNLGKAAETREKEEDENDRKKEKNMKDMLEKDKKEEKEKKECGGDPGSKLQSVPLPAAPRPAPAAMLHLCCTLCASVSYSHTCLFSRFPAFLAQLQLL